MKTAGRTLLSNSAWSLLNQSARVGALAVVTIALSRHFGPETFGTLAVGLALVRIFAVLAAFGLDRVIVRRLAQEETAAGPILRTALRLRLAIAVASYGVLLALVCWIDPRDQMLLMIALLAGGGLLFQPCDVFDYYFQAQNRFRLTFVGRTAPLLFATTLKLGAIAIGAPLLAFAALETIEMALIGVALLLVYRKCAPATVKTAHAKFADPRPLLREGFPLLLGSLAAMIYMRSDVLILGKLAGYRAAGFYSAAAQITEACALLPMAFLPALLPVLVQWRRRGEKPYRQQFEKLFLGALGAGLAVALCLTTAAPLLVRILYGTAYSAAAPILVIHSWSAVFLFLSIIQIGYEVTEGLTWWTAVRTMAGAGVNVALNFALIPRYGAIGSALATLFSLAGAGFLFNLLHRASRPIFGLQLRAFLLVPVIQSILHRSRERAGMPRALALEP